MKPSLQKFQNCLDVWRMLKTHQEAFQNVEIIMQEWIETAQELGRFMPKPKRRLMSA
jgi:predicted RNase H-like HicB family nuclease